MANKNNKIRKKYTVKALLKLRRAHIKRMHMHNRWKWALLRDSKSAIDMERSEVTAGSGRLTLDVFFVIHLMTHQL